jgi:hypothetical protein
MAVNESFRPFFWLSEVERPWFNWVTSVLRFAIKHVFYCHIVAWHLKFLTGIVSLLAYWSIGACLCVRVLTLGRLEEVS